MIPKQILNRLTVHHLADNTFDNTFLQDTRSGLTSLPKKLLPKYFYNELGSCLFQSICCLPEYYITRAESQILSKHAEEIIGEIGKLTGNSIRLIELGSGSAEKTRYFIDPIAKKQTELHYLPIDIDSTSIYSSSQALLYDYSSIQITAYIGDYIAACRVLGLSKSEETNKNRRNVVLFLGSSIGNLEPQEACLLLRDIRNMLYPGDVLLIGADIKKTVSLLINAYNDVLGVTASFNLNLLIRINEELGGNFDIKKFAHKAIYNEVLGRIEMHLISRELQTVCIQSLGLDVSFEENETIHTENSYKFDLEQLAKLASDTGFYLQKTWFDERHMFSFNLFNAT